ncbi:pilus assembly protein PilP [Psychrobacter phenylpyruvicus]|uniref:Pilus assembly protein, PilO n=1 Tax=Psychrobacter phenylpyruvicus TaxID=29432 RepID=A0A379LM30_9GAMM|nr:pilus assembly protein PilP [Psychrobacter phenylpyruvicus]SUD91630.1 Pilus assembly protein, PilO [Psychrobacter phenylpyruvicus]
MIPQQLSQQQTVTKTKRLDLRHWYYELQSLDSQNYGSWPFAVKGFSILVMVLLVALACYLLPISNQLQQIEAEENKQQVLTEKYLSSQAQANQLVTELEQGEDTQLQLDTLSSLMPSIEGVSLTQQLNELGFSSGVVIEDLQLSAEQELDFYNEQSLTLIVSGNYHQIGKFLGSLAALPQLITWHNLSVKALAANNLQQAKSPILDLTLQTKTYRLQPDVFDKTQNAEGVSAFFIPEALEADVAETNDNPYQPKVQRSPFSLPNFITPQLASAAKPDSNRSDALSTQPNEQWQHPLSSFQYRGRISGIGGTYGLIQGADGIVRRVQVGQTLGQDNIKVIEITPTQINFTEQIENSKTGKSENRWALIAPISPFRNGL